MKTRRFFLTLLFFVIAVGAQAQFGPPPGESNVTAAVVSDVKTVKAGDSFHLGVHFKMGPGWHIYGKEPGQYALPTEVKWVLPDGVAAKGGLIWPPDIEFETPMGPDEPPIKNRGYEDEVVLAQAFVINADAKPGPFTVKVEAKWLGCKDVCVPGQAELEWTGTIGATTTADEAGAKLLQTALSQSAAPVAKPDPTPGPTAAAADIPLVRVIVLALVFGVIMNLMPCVWPVLSIKIVHFVEQAGEGRRAWRHGLAFALGIVASFLILAVIVLGVRRGGEVLGWGFQLSSPTFVVLLSFLMFLMGLNFFGVFEIGTGLTGVGQGKAGGGLTGSFLSGMLATVIATPCTGPFMGVYIGYALTQPAPVVVLFFLLLGVGMGLPYLLLTSFPALLKRLPKPGRWMETLKQAMGFILMIFVVYLVYVIQGLSGGDGAAYLLLGLVIASVAAWVLGRWATYEYSQRTRVIVRFVALVILAAGIAGALGLKTWLKSPIDWQQFSRARVQAETAAGKPVFVSFTASWCTSCKANMLAFNERVARRFRELDVVALEADWSRQPPELTEVLAGFGRRSVPFYVIYPADPERDPIILPETLTPGVVLDALEKLE